jgi:hypothetical protein
MSELEPLICPQCGGQITDYPPGATFAICSYCSTKFHVEDNKQRPIAVPPPVIPAVNIPDESDPTQTVIKIFGGVIVAILVVGIIGGLAGKKHNTGAIYDTSTAAASTPAVAPVSPANVRDLIQGQFAGTRSIAVDKLGKVYLSDNLRVQQFDDAGQFVKLLRVPGRGRNYEGAASIDKIEIGDDGRLYVAVGGVILVYAENWAAAPRVVQVAPDYIEDFALKPDGSMVAVSYGDNIETLLFINKQGGVTRHIEGFHTDGLKATVSPVEKAIESVRLAVDSGGNIFSIYALGTHGSFMVKFKDEDLSIARFAPDGKFVKAFSPTRDAYAMLIDAKDRLYVSSRDSITVYDRDGNTIGAPIVSKKLDAFTVDKTGQIYAVIDNAVAKYPPIQ